MQYEIDKKLWLSNQMWIMNFVRKTMGYIFMIIRFMAALNRADFLDMSITNV